MNENDESLPDEQIVDALAPLREVSAPEQVRAANRATIAQALARHTRRPWWQRTVAVPVPVAIAASLAIVSTTVALLLPSFGRQSSERSASQVTAVPVAATAAVSDSDDLSLGAWSMTRSYIQTIEWVPSGRVNLGFETKENRDDS
jgi:hypothetical protein